MGASKKVATSRTLGRVTIPESACHACGGDGTVAGRPAGTPRRCLECNGTGVNVAPEDGAVFGYARRMAALAGSALLEGVNEMAIVEGSDSINEARGCSMHAIATIERALALARGVDQVIDLLQSGSIGGRS